MKGGGLDVEGTEAMRGTGLAVQAPGLTCRERPGILEMRGEVAPPR